MLTPCNISYDYKHYTSEFWMAEWERTDVEQLCIDNILSESDVRALGFCC